MAERRELGAVSKDSNIHPAQPQTGCRLLSLAPELRNSIYELVFDESSDSPVDLRKTKPPSKALLLTCRAIHAQTTLVYRLAYRQYWSTNSFELTIPSNISSGGLQAALDCVKKLADQDCDRMAHVRFVGDFAERTYLGGGVWIRIRPERDHQPRYMYYQDVGDSGEGGERFGDRGRVWQDTDLSNLTSRVSTLAPVSMKVTLQIFILRLIAA